MEKTSKRVLIIDSDETPVTKELLRQEGYTVDTHQIAFGSVSVINLYQPDLILIDINMPGLAGDKLGYLIKSAGRFRDVPIIFYSSNEEDILRCAVKEYKVKGYITKGNIPQLKDKIAGFLNTS